MFRLEFLKLTILKGEISKNEEVTLFGPGILFILWKYDRQVLVHSTGGTRRYDTSTKYLNVRKTAQSMPHAIINPLGTEIGVHQF